MADCPFCERIATGAFDVFTADSMTVCFEPLRPVIQGHLLVVSRSHIINAAADPIVAGACMHKAASLAKQLPSANIITSIGDAATQTVQHLHVHVVPRYPGDGLRLPWSD